MRFSGMLEPPNCGRACSVAFVPQRARSGYASLLVFAKACELGLEGIVAKRWQPIFERKQPPMAEV
jgi:hypothetical protein